MIYCILARGLSLAVLTVSFFSQFFALLCVFLFLSELFADDDVNLSTLDVAARLVVYGEESSRIKKVTFGIKYLREGHKSIRFDANVLLKVHTKYRKKNLLMTDLSSMK
jgi:hypothetical protein